MTSRILFSLLVLPFVNGFSSPLSHYRPVFPTLAKNLPHESFPNPRSSTKTDLQAGSIDDLIKDAFEWNANLGAPAALVAGAVIATFSDKREELTSTPSDAKWVKISKSLCRFLLLSSFCLQVMCIFVTTVTGTMLLSYGSGSTRSVATQTYKSALGLLSKNFEFEYLTARITFIQGLLHWLGAVGIETLLPGENDTEKTKYINKFFASTFLTLMVLMLAFYNSHMTFYKNYAHMLTRYGKVFWKRLVWRWPIRPLGAVTVSTLAVNVYYASKFIQCDLKEDTESS